MSELRSQYRDQERAAARDRETDAALKYMGYEAQNEHLPAAQVITPSVWARLWSWLIGRASRLATALRWKRNET